MNVSVTISGDSQFPVGIVTNDKLQKLTLKAAKELRMSLNAAIEWAVDMDDIRKEKGE